MAGEMFDPFVEAAFGLFKQRYQGGGYVLFLA